MIELLLFSHGDRYTLDQLNDIVSRYAANDQRLLDLVTQLEQYLSTTSFPPGTVKTPAQMEAWVNMILDAGNTNERLYPVNPPEQDRYIGEIEHLFTIEPFKSLIEGVKLEPSKWINMLGIFTILKGMTYLVQDGPSYEEDPVFVPSGSFVYTTITNAYGKHLLSSQDGTPATIEGTLIYRELPVGIYPITLMEFMVRRLMMRRLRQLYRLANFEAGVDSKHHSSYAWDLLQKAFTFGMPDQLPRRYPVGFSKAGDLLFLRTEAARYRGSDLTRFIPGATPTSGVEDRVVMEESLVSTPMGLIRIPRSVISWADLITDNDRQRSETGDPVIAIGLQITAKLQQTGYQGAAYPKNIQGAGFTSGIEPMVKNDAPAFANDPPFTGGQSEAAKFMGKQGHQHGLLAGFIQEDDLSLGPAFAQYGQIQVQAVASTLPGQSFVDSLLTGSQELLDEINSINAGTSERPDAVPYRNLGVTPRKVLRVMEDLNSFPDYDLDIDQGALIKFERLPDEVTWSCIIPLFLHLYKNDRIFSVNNLNGCESRFNDGWAIRVINSVQTGLNSVAFNDGNGQPEAFPEDFLGSEMTIYKADGTSVVTTVVERSGDKLAKLTSGSVAGVQAGDVATFNRRRPSASLDGIYLREAAATNLVDIRPRSHRMVDVEVFESSEGTVSPSPSVAPPWTAVQKTFNPSLALAALDSYKDPAKAIDQKLRWNHLQLSLFKCSERRDTIRLDTISSDLKANLLRWVATYDQNNPHDWIAGENAIIHWPEKSPTTNVRLSRYLTSAVPGQEDGITVEDVPNIGVVPVFTRHIRHGESYRYPVLITNPLVFASERSFTIPSHTKLAGSFSLKPEKSWIVDDLVTVNLYQTRNQNGAKQKILIGSVQFNWRRAKSFVNATGVFRIDGDSRYEPTSQYIKINYNTILDFTNDEPGSLEVISTYHDLTQVHPIFVLDFANLNIGISHLFDATPWSLKDGAFNQIPDLTMRLEGLSFIDGKAYIRFNKDDASNLISQNGFIKSRWVLTGIPIITITSVTYDPASGQPIDLTYTAEMVDKNMTISTLLTNESRCSQFYQPCSLKYGWVDLAQSNMHTEALPFDNNPKFGFFQKREVLDTIGTLTVTPVTYVLKPADIDYRFLGYYNPASPSGIEGITSVLILKNTKTGEIRPITGVYLSNSLSGDLADEITLNNLDQQGTLFIYSSEIDPAEWAIEFAGVLATITDEETATFPEGSSKLTLVGYWYAGHEVKDRIVGVRTRADIVQFNVSLITSNPDFYRVGDVPEAFLYRANNLLESTRTRPPT
jgi:hypothetical protein